MWENAAPQSESQKPPPPRPACENGGDTLLWGQMLFCTVVLLVALAALAELQPVRTLSARTPARSIRFLSFFISIPSSLSIIGISCLTCFALAQYTLVLGKSKLPT